MILGSGVGSGWIFIIDFQGNFRDSWESWNPEWQWAGSSVRIILGLYEPDKMKLGAFWGTKRYS